MQLSAGPLDKVDARGFLIADALEWTELSAEDAAKIGKRVQERAGAARKEIAAKEKAAYLKVHKARVAAASDAALAAALGQTVAQIEQAAAVEVVAIKAKTYATLLKGIGPSASARRHRSRRCRRSPPLRSSSRPCRRQSEPRRCGALRRTRTMTRGRPWRPPSRRWRSLTSAPARRRSSPTRTSTSRTSWRAG